MSSTLAPHSAANCIDGDPNTFCHSLENQASPWLSVGLAASSAINYILLHNRRDCCQDRLSPFQLWVGTSAGDHSSSTSTKCGFEEAVQGDPSDDLTAPATNGPFSFRCTGPAIPPGASSPSVTFDFESGLPTGWSNGGSGSRTWTRKSGGTPSSGTGPSSGHGGSGYYYFTETSGVSSSTFRLAYTGSDCATNPVGTIDFAYHMFGSNIGTLSVVDNAGRTVWSRSNAQSSSQADWRTATAEVDSSSFYFLTSHASGYQGDIAVDSVTINCKPPAVQGGYVTLLLPGSGRTLNLGEIEVIGPPAPPPPPTPPSPPPPSPPPLPPGSTTTLYDFGSTAGWTTGVTGRAWTRRSGGTTSGGTGPSSGYGGSGYYYYIEVSGSIPTGAAFDLNSPSCGGGSTLSNIGFQYHMYGATVGSLELVPAGGSAVWTKTGQQSSDHGDWKTGGATVSGGATSFTFRATRGTSFTGDIAVDHVSVQCVTSSG